MVDDAHYTLQNEILDSIENIDDVTMESEINVLNSIINDYHKSMIIYEHYHGEDISGFDVFQEGFKDTAKTAVSKSKVIFIKILNTIKALLRFIMNQITRAITYVNQMFTKRKITKSVDQILDELKIVPKNKVYTEGVSDDRFVNDSKKISIPSNKLSTSAPADFVAVAKKVSVKFKNKGFTLRGFDVYNHVVKKTRKQFIGAPYNEEVPSNKIIKNLFDDKGKVVDEAFFITQTILTKSEAMKSFHKAISSVKTFLMTNKSDEKTLSGLINFVNNFEYDEGINMDYEYSSKQLIEFQKEIADMYRSISRLNDPSTDIPHDYIEYFRTIITILEGLSLGMNVITGAIKNAPIADLTYEGSITNLEDLDKFVYELIKSGIPPKYVAYDLWLLCDKSIKGEDEEYKPIWGQSRVVLFPPKDINNVYKVAISGMGLDSNMTESRITDMFKNDEEMTNYVAHVTGSYDKNAVIKMERVEVGPDVKFNEEQSKILQSKIAKSLQNKGASFTIKDIHRDNVGISKRTGEVVCFDYGLLKRK